MSENQGGLKESAMEPLVKSILLNIISWSEYINFYPPLHRLFSAILLNFKWLLADSLNES